MSRISISKTIGCLVVFSIATFIIAGTLVCRVSSGNRGNMHYTSCLLGWRLLHIYSISHHCLQGSKRRCEWSLVVRFTAIAANSLHSTSFPWQKSSLPMVYSPDGMVFGCCLLTLLLHRKLGFQADFPMGCWALWRLAVSLLGWEIITTNHQPD